MTDAAQALAEFKKRLKAMDSVSVYIVDRDDSEANPGLVKKAWGWVDDYMRGGTVECMCCGRIFVQPEPAPRRHAFVGVIFGDRNTEQDGVLGGICDDCGSRGEGYVFAGIKAFSLAVLEIELKDIVVRPHQIGKPGRA